MTIDIVDVSESLRKARLARLLTSGSIMLGALYVMSFVYLKTYLAVFGFQVELTSLSVVDLLLLHRYFASQHFFVLSGVLQAHLLYEFRWADIREHKLASSFAFISPMFVLASAYAVSIWSEFGVPKGLNVAAAGLPLAYVAGWLAGGVTYWIARLAIRRPTSIRDATWIILTAVTIYITVATYRLFADAVARDRLRRQDFQVLTRIETDSGPIAGPCALIHVDTRGLYLNCGGMHSVVERERLRSFQVNNVARP